MDGWLRTGLRLAVGVLFVTAAVMLERLVVFVAAAVLSDVPPQWDKALPRLGRGWSLLAGAALLVAAGVLTWRAPRLLPGAPVVRRLGIALVLVAVVGTVWLVRRTESFPAVDESGLAIPGRLAWLDRSEAGEPSCVTVMAADDGAPRTAYCPRGEEGLDFGPGGGGWTVDGQLVVNSTGAADLMLVFVDPDTGEAVDAIPAWRIDWPQTSVREDGAQLVPGHWWGGARVIVESPDGSELRTVTIRGPHDYEITSAQWSPDGEWIALLDNKDRLMVSPADRDEPRVLAQGLGIGKFSWHIEGDPTYSFAMPQLPSDAELCQGYRYRSPTCEFDYAAYAGDLSHAEVRALLLVLDEEYLAAAIAEQAPEPMPAAIAESIERHVTELERIAADHDVGLPPNPWADPIIVGMTQPMSCLWIMYEAFTEGHVIQVVLPGVEATEVRALLAGIDSALVDRIAAVRSCASAEVDS
jgi:hypothetical protein